MLIVRVYSHVVVTSLSDVLILRLKTQQGWLGWLVDSARLNATIFVHRNRGIAPEWSDEKDHFQLSPPPCASPEHLKFCLYPPKTANLFYLLPLPAITVVYPNWDGEVITSFAVNVIALSCRHNVHWTHFENWRKWHKVAIPITELLLDRIWQIEKCTRSAVDSHHQAAFNTIIFSFSSIYPQTSLCFQMLKCIDHLRTEKNGKKKYFICSLALKRPFEGFADHLLQWSRKPRALPLSAIINSNKAILGTWTFRISSP